jgi:hypothetical protein
MVSVNPSGGPTLVPSVAAQDPSSSPTPFPWFIEFEGLAANFSAFSHNELTLEYLFSKTREVQVDALQMKRCEEKVSVNNPGLIVASNSTKTDSTNTTSKKLIITHDIDTSLLGNSSIYNATTKKLSVCQRVKLVLKTDDFNMTIMEDVRDIEVDFDLDFNYTTDTTLKEATIEGNETKTNVNNYIEAYKCNPDANYAPDNSPLAPNTRLHLCIRSLSSDVLIDNLESMIATEQTSGNNIVVIENKNIKNPGITSWIYMNEMHTGPGPGVVVSTFLPINTFAYDNNSKVDITGTIVMKLTGSPDARRLQAANTDSVGTGADAASFDIKVDLQQNIASAEDPIVSAGMFVSNGLGGLVLVFMSAHMMMW